MTLAEIQAADLATVMADAGNTFTHQGSTYSCIVTTSNNRKPFQEGGFMEDDAIQIVALVSAFSVVPAIDTKVTVAGVEYRIIAHEYSHTGIQVTLRCEAVNK